MRKIAILLICLAITTSGCQKKHPVVKDPNAELLKIQQQMQAQQDVIKNLNLPKANAMQPPPALKAPPKVPSKPKPPPLKQS
jgi:hypothetical protein